MQILPEGLVTPKARGKRKKKAKEAEDTEEELNDQEGEIAIKDEKAKRKRSKKSESSTEWKVSMIEAAVVTQEAGVKQELEFEEEKIEVSDRAVVSFPFSIPLRCRSLLISIDIVVITVFQAIDENEEDQLQ